MTPAAQEALDQARALGVAVTVADDADILVSPAMNLTPEARAKLYSNRFEIARFLAHEKQRRPGRARRRRRTAA
jgi:hypothetical protein